jgi:hypothetical protein
VPPRRAPTTRWRRARSAPWHPSRSARGGSRRAPRGCRRARRRCRRSRASAWALVTVYRPPSGSHTCVTAPLRSTATRSSAAAALRPFPGGRPHLLDARGNLAGREEACELAGVRGDHGGRGVGADEVERAPASTTTGHVRGERVREIAEQHERAAVLVDPRTDEPGLHAARGRWTVSGLRSRTARAAPGVRCSAPSRRPRGGPPPPRAPRLPGTRVTRDDASTPREYLSSSGAGAAIHPAASSAVHSCHPVVIHQR